MDDLIVVGFGCFGLLCDNGELFGVVELLIDDGGGIVQIFMCELGGNVWSFFVDDGDFRFNNVFDDVVIVFVQVLVNSFFIVDSGCVGFGMNMLVQKLEI